jgi:hypothetical protein
MSTISFRGLMCCAVCALTATPAAAAERPVAFTNMSPEAITSITARDTHTPDALPMALLATQLDMGDAAQARIGLADDICVVELVITFASGQTKTLPDTDLCQTDQIAVE